MATVTGMTAAAMQAIQDATVVSGSFDSTGHLILTKHDGTQVDAGIMTAATTAQSGIVELATSAETLTGTDTVRAVTPAGLASIPGTKVQIVTGIAESAAYSSYPTGVSLMDVSGWSNGNGFGTVVTNNIYNYRCQQTMYSAAGGTSYPLAWMRHYNSVDGGGGWTAWEQIMLMVNLTPAAYTQSTVFTSYPQGQSRLYYTTVTSTGWDFTGLAGEVITYVSGTDFARQTWTQHVGGSSNHTAIWVRTANSASGWSAWRVQTFDDRLSKLPAAMASGSVTVNPVANTPTLLTVTFPAGRFTSTPNVQVSPLTTVPGTQVLGVGVSNIGITSFDLYVTRTNTTGTVVEWLATQF